MSSGIRTRIALLAAICTLALLSAVGTIGYLVLVDFTRQSQLQVINNRLDEVEAALEADGAARLSARFRVDATVRVVGPEAEIPPPEPGTIRVVRESDHPDVKAVVGAVPTGQIDATLAAIRTGLWISVLVTGLAVGLMTWVVVDQALAPVRRLRRQAEAIEADRSSELLPVDAAGDEMAELAVTFNTMLTKLRTADDDRRRFVSDASHELRSPLMVLMADAEYALQRQDSSPSPELAELAESVQAQTDRLAALVDDLLTLAVADEGLAAVPATQPLPDLLAAVALAGVDTPDLDDHERQVVVPDVSRALVNLVANALRHRSSQVDVGVEVSANDITIMVDDDGPGVPAHERDQVFKRFYRPDQARARSDGGAGLGLAIAKADVDRAGGALTVGVSPLGGARFALTVPQVRQRPALDAPSADGDGVEIVSHD